jgi:hypothetical protein
MTIEIFMHTGKDDHQNLNLIVGAVNFKLKTQTPQMKKLSY